MSIAKTRNSTCHYCDTEYGNGFDGQYCSKLCYYKQQGQTLLNTLAHDHTFCVNCGSQIKEIEKPTDEQLKHITGIHSTNAVIGYQYKTENGQVAQREIGADYKQQTVQGVTCDNCGNTATYTNFPELQNRHLFEYAAGIVDSLEEKHEEHRKTVDRDVFFEMLLETRDLEFSLGKAIQ